MVSTESKKLFIEICKKFVQFKLKFQVKEGKVTESVMIKLTKALEDKFDCKKQFATVQYMKYHIELRFYIIP